MTSPDDLRADEGGEAPCFAHLLDESQCAIPELPVQLPKDLTDAVVADIEPG
jgi:hypothetical protein